MMAYLAFILVGSLAGLCAGLFGIGGGLIVVPALIWLFARQGMHADVIAHVALGTSLAVIVLTSLSSCSAHHKKGNVRWDIVKQLAGGLVMGSLLGAYVAKWLHSDTLQMIIGAGSVLLALKILLAANPYPVNTVPMPRKYLGAGLSIGSLSAIFGIGGGSLIVPLLLHHGLPMKQAVGTSSASGVPIALAGATGFALFGQGVNTGAANTLGFVHVTAFLCVGCASFFAAKIGALLAHQLPASLLKKAFGLLLLIVGSTMIWGGMN